MTPVLVGRVKNIRNAAEPRFEAMRCYVTSSFGDSREEIEKLCLVVRQAGFEDFSFIRDVENHRKTFDNPKDLMRRAVEEIEKSEAFLIDMTDKPTGRAIEAGIAYSLGKMIIVIMRKGTEVKDTTKGVANVLIEYDVIDDILLGLSNIPKG